MINNNNLMMSMICCNLIDLKYYKQFKLESYCFLINKTKKISINKSITYFNIQKKIINHDFILLSSMLIYYLFIKYIQNKLSFYIFLTFYMILLNYLLSIYFLYKLY